MYLLSLGLAVIVPALLLLAYGLIKTRRGLLGEALWAGFVGGIAVGVCVIAWEMLLEWLLPMRSLPPAADAAGHALLIAALPEEGLKFGATLLVVRRFVYLGDVADVILASLAVALGFAVTENAGYVISAPETGMLTMGVVAILRALSAVPLHAICGLAMGALIGSSLWNLETAPLASQLRLTAALLLPVSIHGAYDFLLMLHQRDPSLGWPLQWLPMVFAAAALVAIVLCNRTMRGARAWTDQTGQAGTAGWLGCVLLLVGIALVLLMLVAPGAQAKQGLTVYCVVPLLLGLDMICTAVSRMGRRMPARRPA